MRRLVLAVALAALAAPVAAQDTATVDLAATVIAGIADQARMTLGNVRNADIRKVRPGVFLFVPDGIKADSLYTFSEPEPCVVVISAKLNPPEPEPAYVRLNLSAISDVAVEDKAAADGIPGLKITLTSDSTAATVVMRDGTEQPLPTLSSDVYSTTPAADILAAADAIAARCRAGGEPAPVADAETPLAVDLAAAMVTGMVDGATISIGRQGSVKRLAPGAFMIMGEDGSDGPTVTVTEPTSCTFVMTYAVPGGTPEAIQFDANLITGVTYAPTGTRDGLNTFDILLEGEGAIVNRVTADGLEPRPDNKGNTVTSLTQADLEAAAAALRANYCPGPTS